MVDVLHGGDPLSLARRDADKDDKLLDLLCGVEEEAETEWLAEPDSVDRATLEVRHDHTSKHRLLGAAVAVRLGRDDRDAARLPGPVPLQVLCDRLPGHSLGDDLAFVDQKGASAQPLHSGHVVADEDDGAAALRYLVHLAQALPLELDVP